MVRSYKKKVKPWNEATIDVAIQEIIDGAKIKNTAEKYGMSVGLLWNKLQEHKKGENKENEKRVGTSGQLCTCTNIANHRIDSFSHNQGVCFNLNSC